MNEREFDYAALCFWASFGKVRTLQNEGANIDRAECVSALGWVP